MPREVPFKRRGPEPDPIDVGQRRERRIAHVAHPALERDPRSAYAVLEAARFVLEHDEHAARAVELGLAQASGPIHAFGALELALGGLELFAGDAGHLLDVIALQPRERGLARDVNARGRLSGGGAIGFARVALCEHLALLRTRELTGDADAAYR